MSWGRSTLYRRSKDNMIDTDLDILLSRLQAATYRARKIRDWSECISHPTDEQVDTWLEDLNRLVSETNEMLDGVELG